MSTKRRAGRNPLGWSGEVMRKLGLRAGGHLPAEGMPERVVEGWAVWVTPEVVDKRHRHGSAHRVMARCPGCHKELSLGRMGQHLMVHRED